MFPFMSDEFAWIKDEEPASPASAIAVPFATNTDPNSSPDTPNLSIANANSGRAQTDANPPVAGPSSAGNPTAKRGRASKPKTKSGCAVCKNRRIKCDETRPFCINCVRSNKQCMGYPPPSRSSRPFEEVRIAPKPMPPAAEALPSSGPILLHRNIVLPPRRARHRPPRTTSPSVDRHASPTTYQPSQALPFRPHEELYFAMFRNQTAKELSGYFDSTFWTRRVLQECHSEAAIRHAVVALGALYRTLDQSAESSQQIASSPSNQPDATRNHWSVALDQYSKACQALRDVDHDQPSHKIRIMASVLLACFDSFIGDHKQAITQIQAGMGLLEQFRAQKAQEPLASQEDPLEQDLVTMFTRLAIQAKSYDLAFHFPKPHVIHLTSTSQDNSPSPISSGANTPQSEAPLTIPERFATILEARMVSDKLNESILRFVEGLFSAKTDTKWTLPQAWTDYGTEFKNNLQAWSEAFEPLFLSRTATSVTSQEKAGAAALKMLQINSQVLFSMIFSDQESRFDDFLPQFRTIVELGSEVVSDEEQRAAAERCPDSSQCQHRQRHNSDTFPSFYAPHIKPSFSADLGIVPPLFVVATKCRDPIVRRQAIQLLKSSARREGMWDSELAAHIATWVMNLEESGFRASGSQPSTPGLYQTVLGTIPEEKRVTVRSVTFNLRERTADLQVGTRGLPQGMPDGKLNETHLSW